VESASATLGWPGAPARHGTGRGAPNRVVLAMPVSGVVGEDRRTTHVFVAVTGSPHCLTALCGVRARLDSVDLLEERPGTPCKRCLIVAADRRQFAAPPPRNGT
jgi:hypothetical protein